ncbi:MAG: TerD family protein, partial [Prosthecobacter sp.]|nr:TerD family protein [Prosthecobacter sp.]
MAINLSKGQRVDISLQNLAVGLGWTGVSDLDASAFMVAANGQVPAEEFFVFYGNLESKDLAVKHSGDEKAGGSSDVETIKVDIRKLDPRIEQIIFTVTIYDSETTGENFGQVRNSFIRIYNSCRQSRTVPSLSRSCAKCAWLGAVSVWPKSDW